MTASRVLPISQNTDLVTFTIKVKGKVIPRTVGVLSIVVTKEINRIPTARLTISDGDAATSDFVLSNQETFLPGNAIEISVGYHSDESPVFKGIIIKHSIKIRNGYSQLLVECKDVAVKMTIGEKGRLFADKKDSTAIEEILAEYPDIQATIEETAVEHKELVQYRATDWDFIISRAEANGRVCIVSDGSLNMTRPTIKADALATVLFGATVYEFDAEIDARIQHKQVKTVAWDAATQELAEAIAVEPDWSDNGNLSSNQLADVIGLESNDLVHVGQLSSDELQQWADAQLLRERMARSRGRVKFQGMATVLPGTVLELAGVGDRLNGKVYVSGVRHEISGGNWVCDAQFGLNPEGHTRQFAVNAPPASGLLPAIRGLHIGKVTHLEGDPAGENRIQVKIPTISNTADGVWARVATLNAGKERGTFFLPEVDDEVVIGFLNDDPRFPMVLGMVHSSANPAPLTASDKNPEKAYVSREKLAMRFSDEKKSITLETPGGRIVTLDDDKKQISLSDQSGNSIQLSESGIVIESAGELTIKTKKAIKIESKMDLALKASTTLKAEGSAGIEVSSSATAVLKGSLVQIN